jgi:hypothetical protein
VLDRITWKSLKVLEPEGSQVLRTRPFAPFFDRPSTFPVFSTPYVVGGPCGELRNSGCAAPHYMGTPVAGNPPCGFPPSVEEAVSSTGDAKDCVPERSTELARYLFDDETELSEIPLSKTSKLRVTLVPASDGTTAVSVREWVETSRYSGPTKSGLLLKTIDDVEGVIVALKRAQKDIAEGPRC